MKKNKLFKYVVVPGALGFMLITSPIANAEEADNINKHTPIITKEFEENSDNINLNEETTHKDKEDNLTKKTISSNNKGDEKEDIATKSEENKTVLEKSGIEINTENDENKEKNQDSTKNEAFKIEKSDKEAKKLSVDDESPKSEPDNDNFVEISKNLNNYHRIRLVNFKKNNEDSTNESVKVTIEGETNATGKYELRLSTNVMYDPNHYEIIKKNIDFSKSEDENSKNLKQALISSKTRGEYKLIGNKKYTTNLNIIDETTDEIVGNIKDGVVEIFKIPDNAKKLRYKVTTELLLPKFDAILHDDLSKDIRVDLDYRDHFPIGISEPEDVKSYKNKSKTIASINAEYIARNNKKAYYVTKSKGSNEEGKTTEFNVNSFRENYNYQPNKIYLHQFEDNNGEYKFKIEYSNLDFLELPKEYINENEKISFSAELVNPEALSHDETRRLEFKKVNLNDKNHIVKRVIPGNIGINYPLYTYASDPSLMFNVTYYVHDAEFSHEPSNSTSVLNNLVLDKGNISFDYYNQGSDKRAALNFVSISSILSQLDEVHEYLYKRLTLKNLSLIKKDGSYKIPVYTMKLKQGNKVIKEATIYAEGKLSIPSGSSFSDLYKVSTKTGLSETKKIPIEEKRISDKNLLIGEEKVVNEGEEGLIKTTYDVQYLNGKEYSRLNEKESVVKKMKPKIIHYGISDSLVEKSIENIEFGIKYKEDSNIEYGKTKILQKGENGELEVTRTTTLINGKREIKKTSKILKGKSDKIIGVGNKKSSIESIPYVVIERQTKELQEGDREISVKGKDGTKTTTTIYDVDPDTGKLINPKEVVETVDPVNEVILLGTKKVINAKTIEDIATTTKTKKESIPGKIKYESDDKIDFGTKKVVKDPVDGEKEITTVSQKGKKDKITEKVIKNPQDGVTKVGNKKVEVKPLDPLYKGGEKGSETTTTIYDVDPNTGKLINPVSTTKKSYPSATIEDIATKTKKTTEEVPYNTVYVAKSDLKYGEKRVFQEGSNGAKEVTIVSKVIEGKRIEEKSEKIIKKPTPKIIGVGNRKTEIEKIPFETTEEKDNTLEFGKTETKTKGKDGRKTTTTVAEVDPNTGKLINPKETIETEKPVNEIVLIGNKITTPIFDIVEADDSKVDKEKQEEKDDSKESKENETKEVDDSEERKDVIEEKENSATTSKIKTQKKSSNPKTGVTGITGIMTILGSSIVGLSKTKKKD